MIDADNYLVPTRCVGMGMHQGRAASCNAIVVITVPVHAAQRAKTAFPRSAWEREAA